jgi:hypothetical protein
MIIDGVRDTLPNFILVLAVRHWEPAYTADLDSCDVEVALISGEGIVILFRISHYALLSDRGR